MLAIAAGALAGAMLGAAAAYLYASSAGAERIGNTRLAAELAADIAALRGEVAALRARTAHLKPGVAAYKEPADSTANVASFDSDETVLDDATLAGIAELSAAPRRATPIRFAEPDYDKAMARLMAAGFTAYDAERIFALEAEAQMRFVETMSNPALRGRDSANDIMAELSKSLQEHLGDYGYENYLRARQLPTDVEILRIEEDSIAASAGLREGDRVLSYAGKRVFNIQDLQRLVDSGATGADISIEVLRNGEPERLSLPSGKMGIRARSLSPQAVFDLQPVRQADK
ncbi:MAG: PDZ domain-containing protein [Pseudomonadales bacterium]